MNEEKIILLAHGSGGRMSDELIKEVFQTRWNNPWLSPMLDGAVLDLPSLKIAMTTDSFVITPVFFPGGDIGKLAVCGTVNDLVAVGAVPLFLAASFIIEEGMPWSELEAIAQSMAEQAAESGVYLVTGDTKVVEKGKADKVFINTTGIGHLPEGIAYHPARMEKGDKIIVTGTVGEHGLAVLAARQDLNFTSPVTSDCCSLHRVGKVAREFGLKVKCMRDPTRGGLATILNELARQAKKDLLIRENEVPVLPAVQGLCEMLGLDPLYMANEGKMVLVVEGDCAEEMVLRLRELEESKKAAVIGEVMGDGQGLVVVETPFGGKRLLPVLEGEHLPRIC